MGVRITGINTVWSLNKIPYSGFKSSPRMNAGSLVGERGGNNVLLTLTWAFKLKLVSQARRASSKKLLSSFQKEVPRPLLTMLAK